MTKSIFLAALLSVPLGGCGWYLRPEAAQAPAPPSATDVESGFVPYGGPIWSVPKQGYVLLPCPPGSNYPGALGM
jgi:hypothetical protein